METNKKSWELIRSLGNDPKAKLENTTVNPDQVVTQILLNGKIPRMKPKFKKKKLKRDTTK